MTKHSRRFSKLVACLMLCCTAVLADSQQESWRSGITVVVIEHGHPGPTHPGEPPRYYRGPLAVKRASDGEIMAKGAADKKGHYTFVLPPGEYFITDADQLRPPRNIRSEEIVVVKNQLTAVKLSHDSGMR
jgi:hypothetical protein